MFKKDSPGGGCKQSKIQHVPFIDQRHSEVGVHFLGNLPVQLFWNNFSTHIVNLDVDHALVDAFSSYHQ